MGGEESKSQTVVALFSVYLFPFPQKYLILPREGEERVIKCCNLLGEEPGEYLGSCVSINMMTSFL